ncbi:hypothetical protein DFH09DRAFT_1079823 [Mycena vulgaris]|nr:hypothetical protein DFH09DRAFT_1079823 [Mycena vulgaris]
MKYARIGGIATDRQRAPIDISRPYTPGSGPLVVKGYLGLPEVTRNHEGRLALPAALAGYKRGDQQTGRSEADVLMKNVGPTINSPPMQKYFDGAPALPSLARYASGCGHGILQVVTWLLQSGIKLRAELSS